MASNVRDRLVSAAADGFQALGFSACGVQEIVDRAGVPKGSFYNYFKAKELLAVEVVDRYSVATKLDMLAETGTPPLARLRGHFDFLAKRYATGGYSRGCLIANLAAELSDSTPLVRDALARSLDRWTAGIEGLLREGQAEGSVVAGLDAAQTARFLVNGWIGAVARAKVLDSRAPLDDFLAIGLPLLSGALGTVSLPR